MKLKYIGDSAEVKNQGTIFPRNEAVDIPKDRENAFAKLVENPFFEVEKKKPAKK